MLRSFEVRLDLQLVELQAPDEPLLGSVRNDLHIEAKVQAQTSEQSWLLWTTRLVSEYRVRK